MRNSVIHRVVLVILALSLLVPMVAVPSGVAQAASPAISYGDRVAVTEAGDDVAVRTSYSTGSGLIRRMPAGYEGEVIGGPQNNEGYRWWRIQWVTGDTGWTADASLGGVAYLQPLPGKGVYPIVTHDGLSYRVRVYDDIGTVGLRVREGPSLGAAVKTREYPGDRGWTTGDGPYVSTSEELVWWYIEWDDGAEGWSADSRGDIEAGVYLVKEGSKLLPSASPVSVATYSATGIGQTQATLRGAIASFNNNPSAYIRFWYRPSGGSWTFTSWVFRTSTSIYSEPISGLSPGTNYEFYAEGKGSVDTSSRTGTVLTFATQQPAQDPPPTPTNPRPGSTSSPGPVLDNTMVTLEWDASLGTIYYMLWVYDVNTGSVEAVGMATGISYTVSLQPDTPYRWIVKAYNSGGSSPPTTALYFQTPPAKANLVLELEADNLAYWGDFGSCSIWIENVGDIVANDVSLILMLDDSVQFHNASDNGIYNYDEHSVTWDLGSIVSGSGGFLFVHMNYPEIWECFFDTLEHDATVSTITPEYEYQDNGDHVEILVLPPTRFSLEISAPASVEQGGEITYSIGYSIGPCPSDPSENVMIVDSLSADVEFISASDSGAYADGQVTWELGPLEYPAEGQVTLTVKLRNDVPIGSSIHNEAEISSDPIVFGGRYCTVGIVTTVTGKPATTFGSPGSNPAVPFSAEPVNLPTGNYAYLHQDIYIPTRGLPLQIVRSYNSLDSFHGPFGHGWTFNYGMSLTFSLDGDAILMTEEGRRDFYELNADGSFTSPLGIYSTLIENLDGTYTLKRKDQSKYCFNSTGTLISIADKNGNQSTLTYDTGGRLVSVTGPAGRTLTFSYDAGNHIIAITDPASRTVNYMYDIDDNLVQYTNSDGGQYNFAYDTEHRMTTLTDTVGNLAVTNTYDLAGRVISQTNALGAVTVFTYDPANNLTIETDPLSRQTIYVYDDHFRELSRTDATGNITSYTYDAHGNRNSITDANGHTTSYSYDSNGNIVQMIDALGNIAMMTYDPHNNLISRTDALGHNMTFAYDTSDNLVEVTDALGGITTFAYDVYGQLIGSSDANGNASNFTYDIYGNQITMTDAMGNTVAFTYDIVGRLVAVTDPIGNASLLDYDPLGRVISICDPLGHSISIDYDANGNQIRITDANGYATEYSYDALNQLIGVTDAMGGTATYAYNTVGDMIAVTDANSHNTDYIYDALHRLVEVVDPLGYTKTYQYDPVSNRIAMTDANGETTYYVYDGVNRLTDIHYFDGTSMNYTYDAVGKCLIMTDSHGSTSYTYDDLNRLTNVADADGKVIHYDYDPVGNRVQITYPDSKVVSYSYDNTNRLVGVTDWDGLTTSYSYDANGNPTLIGYPNGATIEYVYDAVGRLLEISNIDHKGEFACLAYTLDAVGNRISVTDAKGRITTYSYDALYRLTCVNGPETNESFTYDAMGNRLAMTIDGEATNYAYDAGDRLLSAGDVTYSYDPNGNLIEKQEKTGRRKARTTRYFYDPANRLVEVSGRGPRTEYVYDGEGNRVQVIVGDNVFSHVWDVGSTLPVVLTEVGPDGMTDFVYGLSVISAHSPSFTNYYHYDGLGSVIGLTNEEGQVKRRYSYEAWGNPVSAPGLLVSENTFAFTGQQWEEGTNLLYLRARYYDPTIGRFLTKDPFAGSVNDPQSQNRYVYARNNPVNLVDLTGLEPSGGYEIVASSALQANLLGPTQGWLTEAWGLAKGFGRGVWNWGKSVVSSVSHGALSIMELEVESAKTMAVAKKQIASSWYLEELAYQLSLGIPLDDVVDFAIGSSYSPTYSRDDLRRMILEKAYELNIQVQPSQLPKR